MWKLRWPFAKLAAKERTPLLVLLGTLAIATILLASCSGGSAVDYCSPWQALRPAQEERLTPSFARQVLTHNLTGNRLCGWEEND